MAETATYIYCLVEHPRRPALTKKIPKGLPGATAPELLPVQKNLWGVVADAPLALYGPDRLEEHLRDVAWVADIAVAHDAVVDYFASKAGAVVPMKIFTMFSTRDRAAADLRGRRKDLQAIFKRIRGCQEWGVRITRRPSAPGADAASSVRTSGTEFLAAKKRARDEAHDAVMKAADAAGEAFAALAALAKSSRRREAPSQATTPPLVDAAFLVSSMRRAKFRATAARLAKTCRASGADLVLTGPWPAYNFVSAEGAQA